jgi:hypothetical protein
MDPASKDVITEARQVFNAFVTVPVKTPASHIATHCLSGFPTHRRTETGEVLSKTVLCLSWGE